MTDDRPSPPAPPGGVRALALAFLAFAFCFAVWGSIAPLAPLFARTFSLSATETGLLIAVPVLLGAVARIPAGLLADRYGGRRVFTGLLLFLLLPVALIGTAGSYLELLFWGFWLGLAGSSFAIGFPFVARWFPPASQGLALGLYGMGNIGSALSAFVAPRIAASYGWPVAFWVFLPLLVLMAALFWTLSREAPGPPGPPASLAERLTLFRTEPRVWWLGLFYFITFGGFVALSIYLPTFLVQAYGLDPADAATRAGGFVVLAILARPVGGLLSDRIGGAHVLDVVFPTVALLAIVLAFLPGMILLTIAFLGIAAALGLGNGAVLKLIAERFPETAGAVSGLVGAAGGIGGFFPPIVMGLVLDLTGGYALGFLLLSAVALLCLIVNVRVFQRGAPEPGG